ncbi:MAG: type II secretion system F family protein [Candidatus Thermoplasmatota archaeon]|nr:type II secretion system F family protein [Candidatus Thermoplasmatota archaeon]
MKPIFKHKNYNVKKIYERDKSILVIAGISVGLSAVLFLFGALALLGIIDLSGSFFSGVDFIIFGLLLAIGPTGFYNSFKLKKKRQIEGRLPDLLREISSSTASGMTIFDAIISAARGDHGRLTKELRRMSSQLSWGISVEDSLNNFAKRLGADSVKRMVITVNKALAIGGNTSAVFEAAAKELDQTKLVEQQRQAEMSMYAIVIFISFFVFLAVILIIDKTIFQAIFDLQDQMVGQSVGGMQFAQVDQEMLKNTFLSFVVVQSVGGGLLGGFMMDGNLSSGVRFGFILVLISFFVFKFMF